MKQIEYNGVNVPIINPLDLSGKEARAIWADILDTISKEEVGHKAYAYIYDDLLVPLYQKYMSNVAIDFDALDIPYKELVNATFELWSEAFLGSKSSKKEAQEKKETRKQEKIEVDQAI